MERRWPTTSTMLTSTVVPAIKSSNFRCVTCRRQQQRDDGASDVAKRLLARLPSGCVWSGQEAHVAGPTSGPAAPLVRSVPRTQRAPGPLGPPSVTKPNTRSRCDEYFLLMASWATLAHTFLIIGGTTGVTAPLQPITGKAGETNKPRIESENKKKLPIYYMPCLIMINHHDHHSCTHPPCPHERERERPV